MSTRNPSRSRPSIALAGVLLGACGGGGSDEPLVVDDAASGASSQVPAQDPAQGSSEAPSENPSQTLSGSSSSNGGSADFTVGVLSIVQNLPPDARTDMVAGFLDLGPSATATSPEETGGDDCRVEAPIVPSTVSVAALQDQAFGNVDVGDALVISSPAGTLATLRANRSSGRVGYSASIDTPVVAGASGGTLRGLPEGLVLDIPGAAAASLDVPHIEPIDGLDPVPGDTVDGAVAFAWAPSSSDPSRIEIALTNDDASITCNLVDDGGFVVPGALMGTEDGVTYRWSGGGRVVYVSRQVQRVQSVGEGATVAITNLLFDDIVVR